MVAKEMGFSRSATGAQPASGVQFASRIEWQRGAFFGKESDLPRLKRGFHG
jgi:hypothetical protein